MVGSLKWCSNLLLYTLRSSYLDVYIIACNVELLLAQSSVVIAVGDAGTDTVTNKPHENNPEGHENGKYHDSSVIMKYCGKFFTV